MSAEGRNDESDREDARTDGGFPTNAALAQRLVAVEEGQNHLGERFDGVEEKIDGLADDLDGRLEQVETQNSALWTGVEFVKWAGPLILGSGAATYLVQHLA